VPEKFRLEDMLSLTLRAPLSWRWPPDEDRSLKLFLYMIDEPIPPSNVSQMIDLCAIDLCKQHPWLAKIDIPDAVRESCNWARLYAWLDKAERRFGEWHEVEPIADLDQSRVITIDFSLLPPDVRTRLKEMGFDPEQ
jgi:hypothetical protein